MKRLPPRLRRTARKWTRPQIGAGLLALAAAMFAAHSLAARFHWERDRVVEICVDGEELRSLTDSDDDRTREALADLADRGVAGVAVYWDPSFSLPNVLREWDSRVPDGLAVTLRPEAAPFSDWRHRWPRAARIGAGSFPPVAHALFPGPAVPGYPDTGAVEAWIVSSSLTLPWVEFSRQRGTSRLLRLFPERILRAHTLTEEEMNQAGPEQVIARYRRAVRDRGARFLYVRLFPGLSLETNIEFLGALAGALREEGCVLSRAAPRWKKFPRPLWPLTPAARQALAFFAAVVGPLAGFVWGSRFPKAWSASLAVTGATLAVALAVAVFLSAPAFVLGFEGFRGIKLGLLLPLAAAVFIFYRAGEIRHVLREPVNVERLLVSGLFLGAAAYTFFLSGPGTAVDTGGGKELELRGFWERTLGVRPRGKEFFVCHPLLLFGFYLRARFPDGKSPFPNRPGAGAQALRFLVHDHRPFLLAGFLGQLSIVNSFCHAHTPLKISLLRTFHGLWMGAALGLGLVALFDWAYRRWSAGRT